MSVNVSIRFLFVLNSHRRTRTHCHCRPVSWCAFEIRIRWRKWWNKISNKKNDNELTFLFSGQNTHSQRQRQQQRMDEWSEWNWNWWWKDPGEKWENSIKFMSNVQLSAVQLVTLVYIQPIIWSPRTHKMHQRRRRRRRWWQRRRQQQ